MGTQTGYGAAATPYSAAGRSAAQTLDPIGQLLIDRRDIQVEDPLELVLSETPAPAIILSPKSLVAAHNFGAAAYLGVEQVLRAGTEWLL